MYLLYTILLTGALLLASPYYILRFRRFIPTIRERLGFLPLPPLRGSIWIHAVSVGEVRSVQNLIARLRATYPDRPLVVSTVTPAGQQMARESLRAVDHVFYFPFDLPGAVRRTLERVDPELVIIAETEIWPNFLRACRARRTRVVMVNGRISDRSLPRYRLIRRWLRSVLDAYTVLGMQSEADGRRIEMMGADRAKVTVFGNLKYDAVAGIGPLDPELDRVLSESRPLWIAASTTPGEEEQVLAAFRDVAVRHPSVRLMVAPRHPQRFDAVEKLITSAGYRCRRRTRLDEDGDVLLLDSIGELAAAFRHAAVVFMGGTLVPRGGHNILEPAVFAKPIVFGPHMENFREIRDVFLSERAAIEVPDAAGLAKAVSALLDDSHAAAELGANARRIVELNIGATERVMACLEPLEARP